MNLSFSADINKQKVFEIIENYLNDFKVISKDINRPWGGFFVIDESQAGDFINTFFPLFNEIELLAGNKLSPKILVVAPGQRLSWQYHFRRSEIWKVIGGEVGVAISETDEETEMKIYTPGAIIKLGTGERHRLIGLASWGIVAEIWQHTDTSNPSNEEDIVRLQDDFGR